MGAGGLAARITDLVAHPLPGKLLPGPGSPNVIIGGLPAWRAVGGAAAAAIQAAKATSDAAIKIAEAATLAAAGTPGAPAAKAAEETVKATAATTMGSMINGAAGGADIHVCATPLPIPPHGPGVVVDGSPTVFINNLPASRLGDMVVEAVGPPDLIVMGCPTVLIGNIGGGGGGAGGAAGAVAGGAAAGPAQAGGVPGGAPSPKPTFATPEEAAKAALRAANPASIRDNLEYGGIIYKDANGRYSYTGPARGTDQGFDPSSAPAPPGTTAVGDYHTHGDYSTMDPATGKAVRTGDPARDDFNSDDFSQTDRDGIANDAAGKPGYKGYLGTPSGKFKQYDPSTGRTTDL